MTLDEIHEILLNIEPERGGHLTGDYKTAKLILASHLRSQIETLNKLISQIKAKRYNDAKVFKSAYMGAHNEGTGLAITILVNNKEELEDQLTKLNQ